MYVSQCLFIATSLVLLTKQSLARSYEVPEKVYYDIDLSENIFKNFVSEHQKTYTAEEAEYRHQVFRQNLKIINELNAEHESAVFGLTLFSDLTSEEFKEKVSCFNNSVDVEAIEVPDIEAPDHLDWRDKKIVTEVKDQKDCSTCFIFAAIGEIEGQHAKLHNELISLSEQYPIDCNDDFSCGYGGSPDDVMTWLANQTEGAIKEQDYPFVDYDEACQASSKKGVVKVKGGKASKIKSSVELKKLLASHGPLAVAVSADGKGWQNYKGGILKTHECYKIADHAVTLVGYGKEKEDYWILKNSWGQDWGEKGYIRLVVDTCAVGTYIAQSEVA